MMKLDNFINMMTGHFNNKEQFDNMQREGKTYPYVHVLLGKHADTGNVVRNQTAHAGDSAVLTSMYSAMRQS